MLIRPLVRLLRRALGTDTLLERTACLNSVPAGGGPGRPNLAAVVRQIVRRAGEDGVLSCTINDCRLNVPGGMLLMLDHCLHATLEDPLRCYVETRHLEWMRSRLRPGDVAVDVGASGGLLTAALAQTVGPAGRVFAFEPADRAFRLLQRLVLFNGLENVTAEKRAVSGASGTVRFAEYHFSADDDVAWRPEASALFSAAGIDAGRAKTYEVPVATLDEYFAPARIGVRPETPYGAGVPPASAAGTAAPQGRVKLIKIDVEGFEAEVLRGAAELIERDRPALCIDIHQRVDGGDGTTEEEVRGLLAPHGYRFEKMHHVLAAAAREAAVRKAPPRAAAA